MEAEYFYTDIPSGRFLTGLSRRDIDWNSDSVAFLYAHYWEKWEYVRDDIYSILDGAGGYDSVSHRVK